MFLRPVKSIKHIVETNGTVTAALASTTDVINTVDAPAYNVTPNQVSTGAQIHGIYLRVEVKGRVQAGGIQNVYMAVYKNLGNNLTLGPIDLIGTTDLRRYVIHQEMLMVSGQDLSTGLGFPRTMFKGVIIIPKSLKRFGVQDKLQVILQHRSGEATQTTEFCIECIYKEFGI